MAQRYQIHRQKAIQMFRHLVAEQNPAIQLLLPMSEVVSLLQEGVGNLLWGSGAATDVVDHGRGGSATGRGTEPTRSATAGVPVGTGSGALRGGWAEGPDSAPAGAGPPEPGATAGQL